MNPTTARPNRTLLNLLVGSGLLLALGLASGCSATCPQVQQSYAQALAKESALEEKSPEGKERPVQFGLTLRADLLNNIANTAIQGALKTGLNAVSDIDVGAGQTVGVKTSGDVVNLNIQPSDACEHCFRISGKLDGAVGLDIPFVGNKRTKLGGNLSVVAPVLLAQGKDGGGVLQFDIASAAKIGKSSLSTTLGDLPGSWSRVLQSKLSTVLLNKLLEGQKPIDLFSFEGPSLGIPGMEILPARLVTDAKTGTIYAGFSTNISGLQNEKNIAPVTQLNSDQNLALSFNPNMIVHAISLMMKSDIIPRQYSSDGKAQRDGSAHATVNAVRFTQGEDGELPMHVDFSVFDFGAGQSMCYQFAGSAGGKIALKSNRLQVSLTDADITDSSIPGFATAMNWGKASFLQSSKTVINKSLDPQNIEIPGGKLGFRGLSVNLEGGAVVLRGDSSPINAGAN
ncbi:hypothetical protein [Bradymonas sediminis]|uniref:Uncharacterized protein n=1 Tax=Bradymonas sediminis TaxID=1548548 RepID=A0A2Z4FL15_9DELT|nr:hypothetical protein [Bradymonas sediminis]AWV89520.1 hypothetical protein DN745_09270 [Bradymonas sediminis]TDP76752.1 hypothetical protein DFR33_102389 [Bradymonas sediminis]